LHAGNGDRISTSRMVIVGDSEDILAPRRDDDQDDRSVKATPAPPLRRPRTPSSIWRTRQ
jgi:hypothetical protein